MDLKKIGTEFLKFIVRSVLFSAVMLVGSYSYMTKQFPPDFRKLQNYFANVMKLKEISSEVNKIQSNYSGQDDEVAALLEQRKKLAEVMTVLNPSVNGQQVMPEISKEMICQQEFTALEDLKLKVKQLADQNLELNKELLQLKYNRN